MRGVLFEGSLNCKASHKAGVEAGLHIVSRIFRRLGSGSAAVLQV